MAYINFSEAGGSSVGRSISVAPKGFVKPVARASALSPLEWQVVALARGDRIASVKKPGRVARALQWLFGLKHANSLSNMRLEALRRMAVLSWHRGYSVPEGEVRTFISAGFTLAHYNILLTHINATRRTSAKV